MTYQLEWRNDAHTILAKIEGTHTLLVEPGHPLWDELSQSSEIAEFVDPRDYAAEARAQRNALLAASDWSQLPDAPVDQAAWAAYRQALRDVPAQDDFPANIAWPQNP